MAPREPEPHGGLSLDDIPPLEEEDRPANPYEDLFEQAVRELEQKKIRLHSLKEPDGDLPDLPNDLTTLGTALFDWYQETLKHWSWVASVEADLESRLSILSQQLDHIVASLQTRLKKKEKTDPAIILDEEYIKCNTKITMIKAQLKLMAPVKGDLTKRMQLLSRSVEGAKMEHQGVVRSETFGKRHFRGSRGGLPTDL